MQTLRFRHKLLFLFALHLVIINSNLFSQSKVNKSYSISTLENIPQNDVICIFNDSKGFMWLGTLDGLHKYDGYSYKTYRVDDSLNCISSNMIIAIDEDHLGNIWIGTYGMGICKLNTITEEFTSYTKCGNDCFSIPSNDISTILADDNNTLWIGNWDGLNRLKLDNSMNEIISQDLLLGNFFNVRDKGTIIKTIFKDTDNEIWIGTNRELLKLQNPYAGTENFKYEIYSTYDIATICNFKGGILVGGASGTSIIKDVNGTHTISVISELTAKSVLYNNESIWIGNRNGIHCLKLNSKEEWIKYSQLYTSQFRKASSSNIITSIATNKHQQIWFGSRGGGVKILTNEGERFDHYKNTPHKSSISNNLVKCIFEDHNNNLWMGTERGGISYLKGPDKYNYSTGFKHITINNYPIENNRVYAINEMLTPNSTEQKSIIWMGTSFPTNILAIDPISLRQKTLPDYISRIGFVFAIEIQNDSVLWAGTYGEGLWKFITDKNGNIKKHYHYTPNDKSDHPISSSIIRSILADKNGNLWIGTDKGLNFVSNRNINKQQLDFIPINKKNDTKKFKHDYILQLFEAKNGTIWYGTMGSGLIGLNYNNELSEYTTTSVTIKDGLPNNSIKSILEDDKGFLWLSSNQGLSKYNPKSGDIINYDTEDGLQDNEFGEIAAYKRSNGELLFGGINGFNTFFPDKFTIDSIKPELYFTDFYISNKKIKPGQEINGDIILDKSIDHTKKINLKYIQNSFSIGFTGLQFHSPQKNNYKYKLEGFDKHWFTATAEHRIAKYTNIPNGNYTFKVMASNCDNIWTDNPIKLQIHVKPPNYRSTWAYFIYLCIGVLLVVIAYTIIRWKNLRKNELLISQIERKNSEKNSHMKLKFFTNISHEFRTPLTIITNSIENLIKGKNDLNEEECSNNYSLIKNNSNVMLRLITQLMDFRSVEMNKMKIVPEENDIILFTRTIFKQFEPWANKKHIQFSLNTKNEPIMIWFDPEKIEKILYNLLSNAIKFTPSDGSIQLTVEMNQEKFVVLSIKDSGIGIDKNEQQHIFERYYQSNKKGKEILGGTGIGLALSKDLAKLHCGKISLESTKGRGSNFQLFLHANKDWMNKSTSESISNSTEVLSKEINLDSGNYEKSHELLQGEYKILIVEDNVDLRKILIDIFKTLFTVIEAKNGQQGYALCTKHHPDIILSDVMMPIMNGVELCYKIKNDELISHIPVILLTAKSSIEAQIEGHQTGADCYISKPFNSDVLKANIIATIKNRENLRSKFQKEIEINPMTISNSPADSKFLTKIIEIIEDNISDSEFSVEKMADAYGVSRIYLNRKIKSLTGETSNLFLRNIRLKHAAELLKQNKLSISEVTWKVGYNDLQTFRIRFKEKFGVSPSDYAKNTPKKDNV